MMSYKSSPVFPLTAQPAFPALIWTSSHERIRGHYVFRCVVDNDYLLHDQHSHTHQRDEEGNYFNHREGGGKAVISIVLISSIGFLTGPDITSGTNNSALWSKSSPTFKTSDGEIHPYPTCDQGVPYVDAGDHGDFEAGCLLPDGTKLVSSYGRGKP
jgi:hypothetical protein